MVSRRDGVSYDLIIVGAGPGGCMAARKAARDGLRVLIVEKAKEAGTITRFCSRLLRLGSGGFSSNKPVTDIKMNRATCTVEIGPPGEHIIHMNTLPDEASIPYAGEFAPVFNESWVAPSGASFERDSHGRDVDGFVVDKEELLKGLLREAAAAGCEIRSGTKCIEIEDTDDGVRLKVKTYTGEETLRARRAIVADGSFSPLIEQLGFNEGRGDGRGRIKFMSFIFDRCDVPFKENRRLRCTQPSLHSGFLNFGPWPPGLWEISCSAPVANTVKLPDILKGFMTNSAFSHWFGGATVVGKQACNMDLRRPVRDTARGNVICIGDNAAYAETAIKGALGCGYKAAEATTAALEGKDGNAQYIEYWTHAFNFFSPQYNKRGRRLASIPSVLDDNETDVLYRWFKDSGIYGLPADILPDNRDRLSEELPGIAAKFFGNETKSGGAQAA